MQASQPKVLLVEDDLDTRENIADILELDGLEAVSFGDCHSSIAWLNQRESTEEAPMAAIVDWQLPDGEADHLIPIFLKQIPNLPIVIVTGYRELDMSISALRAGAYDYILKPINADVFRSTFDRIKERRQHLLQIKATQDRLVQKERLAAIGQIVAGLAHESRNALQRSQACLEMLALDVGGKQESLLLVQKIQKALDDLHALYEEVRDYSAPINLKRKPSQLLELIQETWLDLTPDSHANFKFVCRHSSEEPPIATVDSTRMRQVFRNLFENSLMACGDQGEISIDVYEQNVSPDNQIQIHVIDNGPGIDPATRANIFQPFFTTKTKGTGLGLAITRRIVEAHNGTIEATDHQTQGACFVLTLPK